MDAMSELGALHESGLSSLSQHVADDCLGNVQIPKESKELSVGV